MPSNDGAPKRYRAFISYSHAHEIIARKFHRKLESYRPPKGVATEAGDKPSRINPVFRDRDELASATCGIKSLTLL